MILKHFLINMYETEIKLLENLITRFTKNGRDTGCITTKESCAYAIGEFKEIIKEYKRADEARRLQQDVPTVPGKDN